MEENRQLYIFLVKTIGNMMFPNTQIFFFVSFFQSYGGFLTASVLGQQTDEVFKCGISVAPVTDWRYYGECYAPFLIVKK